MPRPPRPLVGRRAELDRLVGALGVRDSDAATAHAALLGGDAGIGKTRLLGELTDVATATGWRVLTGHCLDVGAEEVAYLPLTEVLGRLLAEDPDVTGPVLAAHPATRRLVPRRHRPHEPEVPVERGELLESVLGLLGDLAAGRPTLLVVEDAHWADQSTRDVLSLLLARPSATPLRVVVSYRGDDLHRRHPLRPALAQWSRLPGVERVQLGPLPPDDVRALARGFGEHDVPEARLADVVERADGNAFFVEELVGALAAGDAELPVDLADLLLVRLDHLDDAARAVVRAASVDGRLVPVALLAAVVDVDGADLDAALRTAVERHVLVTGADGTLAFRHALLAEAVYDDLMPGERTRLHGRYARALREGVVAGSAAELARHARLAGQHEVALRASVDAGDEALRVGGPGEAARHYERAIEMLGVDGGSDGLAGVDPVDLAVRAARALVDAGHVDRALQLARDAVAHLPEDATAVDRVRLLVVQSEATLVGDVDDPRVPARAARALVADVDDALRAQVLSAFARAVDVDEAEDALAAAHEARVLAERTGQPRLAGAARVTAARLEEVLGDPDASRRVLDETARQARADGDVVTELRSGYHLATLRLEGGDPRAAAAEYAAVAERGRSLRRPWAPFGVDAWSLQVTSAYVAGEWDDALAAADLAGWDPPPVPAALIEGAALLVCAGRGDHDGGLDRVRAVADRDVYVAMLAAGAGTDLLGDVGDVAGAVALHDDMTALVVRGWGPRFGARVRLGALLLGQLAGHAGTADADQREAWLRRADDVREAAHEVGTIQQGRRLGVEALAWTARTEAERARLRWVLGEPSDADELVGLWTTAVESFEAMGHVFEAARSRARLAVALRAAGRRPEAAEAAGEARVVAVRLGARPLLRELAASRLDPGPSGGAGDDLTAREHEILQLVAQGRTNGEIGARLFISTKTVSVHVSRILAKLGASGRTEAAAIGRRRGLVDGTEDGDLWIVVSLGFVVATATTNPRSS